MVIIGGRGGLDIYELWTYDIARETPTALAVNATAPLWSPGGERLLYWFLTQMCARFSPSRSAAPWEEGADALVPANQR